MTQLKEAKCFLIIFAILLENGKVNGVFNEIQETLGNSLSYLKRGMCVISLFFTYQNMYVLLDNMYLCIYGTK